ncbi:protein of unknown function [Thermococcus camini]|uniref:Uncharacterized protein n=1 Tax=Thermococcus camini TaxID=2016373 RepID=A0A7G2D7Y4_9EURY|nr:protein of unknown function [Thermococcus camini]
MRKKYDESFHTIPFYGNGLLDELVALDKRVFPHDTVLRKQTPSRHTAGQL